MEGTIAISLFTSVLFLLAMFLPQGVPAQQEEQRDLRLHGRDTQVPSNKISRTPSKNAFKEHKFVIAPPTVSIPDGRTLNRRLLPYSTPPGSVAVELKNHTSVTVDYVESIENWEFCPKPDRYRKCTCQCVSGKLFKWGARDATTLSQCCDRCCKMGLERPQPLPPERMAGLSLAQGAEVNASLATVGLQRVLNKTKAYPISLFCWDRGPISSKRSLAWKKMRRVIVSTGGFAGQPIAEGTSAARL